MNERFERMDRMMEGAGRLHGEQLHRRLNDHMHMMQEQMGAMSGMMGPGMMGGGPQGGSMGPQSAEGWQRMQERMDLMQRMMEQMLKQQQRMQEDENG